MTFLKKNIVALLLAFTLTAPIAVSAPISVMAETTNIEDEQTPLGAAEDLCSVHWIVLILSVVVGGYTAVRVISSVKKESEVAEQKMI